MIHILLFYKYVKIDNPKMFARKHLAICKKIGLLGRILVAKEGINGSVSGTEEQINEYKDQMSKNALFKDIIFKEDLGLENPFKKMNIKVKNELVRFEQNVNLSNTGKHISPEEFLDLYNKKEDVIILDARNDYESKVGKFKNAITPSIKTFKEFPKVAELLKDQKDKKIVMYCTGGIRCEKASAYLIEKGFKNVSQLDGGILTFGKKFPDSVWEGKCFVFDKRMVSSINTNDSCLSKCQHCNKNCDLYRNCRNKTCDKLFSICKNCEDAMQGCCSEDCFNKNLILVKNHNN
jgi:UPF0176 protein